MKIVLDSGEKLQLSTEQRDALKAFLVHPSNQVPHWDENKQATLSKPKWKTIDDWIEFQLNMLLAGVFATCPPTAVATIQDQIDALEIQRKAATKPTKGLEVVA